MVYNALLVHKGSLGRVLSSVLYFSFYHLPFVTLSTYFKFSRAILLLISKVLFPFLNLKMISAKSKRGKFFSLVFIYFKIAIKIPTERGPRH